jgi:hypothetical protein
MKRYPEQNYPWISATAFALVILVAASACTSARVELYTTTAADLGTTRIGINNGYREVSPIYSNFATFAFSQIAVNEAVLAYSRYLERRGNRYYRLPIHIFSTIHGAAAGWNTYQLMR